LDQKTDLVSLLIIIIIFFFSLLVFLLRRRSSKKPKAPSFQIVRDEIWQNCSSNKYRYTSIDRIGFFDSTSHLQDDVNSHKNCCHVVSAHAASAPRICSSVRQFLIYRPNTFVFVAKIDKAV